MLCKYFLYSNLNSYVFSLKKEGEAWLKEFTSITDAVTYAESLPGSEEATVVVFDPSGGRLAELRVRDDALAVI